MPELTDPQDRALRARTPPAPLRPRPARRLAGAFESRRDRTCAALREAGFGVLAPQGSCYVLADVRGRGLEHGARQAAMALLEATGVAAVPGTACFRGAQGDRLLRFCFGKEDPVLDQACERLRSWRA